jgi:prolipoprotein diacylglyceryltransferase
LQFPVYVHFGSVSILLHTIAEFAGIFIGFRYFLFLRKIQGDSVDSSNRLWIIIGAIFGALLGSRILGALEKPHELFSTENKLIYIYSNKTVVGGLLGGLWGVELIKKMIHEKKRSGDLFVFPLILAMIIGRVGCFSMGVFEETYGLQSRIPWAMDLGDGIRRHPVCLYEIFFLFISWISLYRIKKSYALDEGALFKLFMISYLLFRFLLDFIKPGERYLFGMGTIQLVCLAGLLYYYRYLFKPRFLLKPQVVLNN